MNPFTRAIIEADGRPQPTLRRLMREKVRQLARTACGEDIGHLFYATRATIGWTVPNHRGRRIGLPWSAQSMHGLAVAFIRYGIRETVRIARAAGYSASEVAKWAVTARRWIVIVSGNPTAQVQP